MRFVVELIQEAKWRTICFDGHWRTGGEINSDAFDIRRIDTTLREHCWNSIGKDIEIILRMLQRPIWRKPFAGWQSFIHHGMRIIEDSFGNFAAIARIHQNRTSGQRSKNRAQWCT